ncbi:MAG: gliding motility-associated C-terminal domain-containing protein [Ichthyobacteriaceae bacterium]|nr:gliding motility-associated C-terminal domain-containing protein [Ichthyobacteriaceae bacterium]
MKQANFMDNFKDYIGFNNLIKNRVVSLLLLVFVMALPMSGISQSIDKGRFYLADLCAGETYSYPGGLLNFKVSGDFAESEKFEIVLSNSKSSFDEPTLLGTVDYVKGVTRYKLESISIPYIDGGNGYSVKIQCKSDKSINNIIATLVNVVPGVIVNATVSTPSDFCIGGSVEIKGIVTLPDGSELTEGYGDLLTWYYAENDISYEYEFLASGELSITAEKSGFYYVDYFSGACDFRSDVIEVRVTEEPISAFVTSIPDIDIEDSSAKFFDVCVGEEITLKASSTNIEEPIYEWYNESDVLVGNGETYPVTVTGKYYLKTLNLGVCSNESDLVEVIVHDFNAKIVENGNGFSIVDNKVKVCVGTDIGLTSEFKSADVEYTYTWSKNGVEIQKATTPELSIPGEISESGKYTLNIKGPAVCEKSYQLEVIVKEIPAEITYSVELQNESLGSIDGRKVKSCAGNTVTFVSDVIDSGNEFNYTWYKDGKIVGNSKQLSIEVDELENSKYYLDVAFGYDCSVSGPKYTVEYIESPKSEIKVDGELILCENDEVKLRSVNTDSDYSYNWYNSKNELLYTGNPFKVNSVSMKGYGEFEITLDVVNNSTCNSISESVNVVLSKNPDPVISLIGDYNNEGENKIYICDQITLSSATTINMVDENVTYEWFKGSVVIGTDADITVKEKGQYKLSVTNYDKCTMYSEILTVTVPEYKCDILDENNNSVEYVKLCNKAPITLKAKDGWKKLGNTFSWTYIDAGVDSGTTLSTDTVFIANKEGRYELTVFDNLASGCVKRDTVEVKYIITPSVEIIGESNITLCVNTGDKLQVSLQDTVSPSYQWYQAKDTKAPGNSTEIDYAPTINGEYYLVVTNDGTCYSEPSNIINVTVENLEVEAVVTNDSVCSGDYIHLKVAGGKNPDLTYEWKFNDKVISNEYNFKLKKSQVENSGDYILTVYGNVCEVSDTATVVVVERVPAKIIPSKNQYICNENGVELKLESKFNASNYTYQWVKNSEDIEGATKSTYFVQYDDDGSYQVKLSNYGLCDTISKPLDVRYMNFEVEISGASSGCNGSPIILTSSITDTLFNYHWFEVVGGNKLEVTNVNQPAITFNVPDVVKADAKYVVEVRNEFDNVINSCSVLSKEFNVTVNENPNAVIKVVDGGEKFCDGSEVVLKSESISDLFKYEWYLNDKVVGSGSEFIVSVSNETIGGYTLSVENTETGCYSLSEAVEVENIIKPVSIILGARGQVLCDGTDLVLKSGSTNLFNPTYKWVRVTDDGVMYVSDYADLELGFSDESGKYVLHTINDGICESVSDTVVVHISKNAEAIIAGDAYRESCTTVLLKSISEDVEEVVKYQWYKEDNSGVYEPIADATDIELNVTKELNGIGSSFYKLEVLNYGECGVLSEAVEVDIFDYSANIIDQETAPIRVECMGNDVTLKAQVYDDFADGKVSEFAWYRLTDVLDRDPEKISSSETFSVVESFVVSGGNENHGYYYFGVERGECITYSDTIDVFIGKLKEPYINGGALTEIVCNNSEHVLVARADNVVIKGVGDGVGNMPVKYYTYKWYKTGNGIVDELVYDSEKTVNDVANNQFEIDVNGAGYSYKVEVSLGSCVSIISKPLSIEVYDISTLINNGDESVVLCNNDTEGVKLTVTSNEDYKLKTYTWMLDGDTLFGEELPIHNAVMPGEYVVNVTELDTEWGCSLSDTIYVEFSGDETGVRQKLVEASVGDVISLDAYGGYDYLWYLLDGEKYVLIQDGGETLDVIVETSNKYQVKILSNDGCDNTYDVEVILDDFSSDDIQNLVTPNGDGVNDNWVLPESIVMIEGVEVTILTRQGSIVMQKKLYSNDWPQLNGGANLPAGTYYYVIKQPKKNPIMGSVTIFK